MIPHSYSLRERLDLIAGGLLFCIAMAGCLALELAQSQRQDARLLLALRDQERRVETVTRVGELLAHGWLEPSTVDVERVEEFRKDIEQVAQALRLLQHGGLLLQESGQPIRVRALQGTVISPQLNAALDLIELYRQRVDEILERGAAMEPARLAAVRRDLVQYGRELQTVARGIATGVESQSLEAVVWASELQLVVMFGGVLMFLLGVFVLRRFVTTPLHRMVDGIEAMQRTGRLVKLPVIHHNELSVVAAEFNRLAEQVEEQKQRLREHITELQRMNLELGHLATLKDDFLRTINHQLRTPLTAIIEGIGLLRDRSLGPLSEDQQSFVQTMSENAKRLDQLIEEILDLSLIESGRRPLARKPDDLAAVLRQLQTTWQAAAPFRGVQVTDEALPPVYMDVEAVREVVDHLVRNAIRHAPEQTTVGVMTRVHDGVVEVAVYDQGPGMSPRQLERLFQPFVHVHTPDAPGAEGSGLGLAFCRQVIERHRGSIRAESSEGHGMTVTFTLPQASPQFLFEEACHDAQQDAEGEQGQFGILLIGPSDRRAAPSAAAEMMRRAEAVLRRNTHRGDQLVWLDETTLVIVAVTDHAGLEAMAVRLGRVAGESQLGVLLTSAHQDVDGRTPEVLLEAARRRFSTLHTGSLGAIGMDEAREGSG